VAPDLLALTALAAYAAAEVFAVKNLRKPNGRAASLIVICLGAGLAVQFAALEIRGRQLHSVPYRDLTDSMSLFAWMLAIAYLILLARHHESAAGPFLIPLILIFLAISFFSPATAAAPDPKLRGSLFALHVTIAILGYAALTLSFVLALLYLIQSRQIQRRQTGLLFARLPSLEALARLEETTIAIGVAALSVSTIFGLVWAERTWGTIRDAKLSATIMTILIYAGALLASRRGWRGRRACLLSIGGFAVLLFSYTVVNLFVSQEHLFR
jgi:ABC-type uncharacterized transport system permease subunit